LIRAILIITSILLVALGSAADVATDTDGRSPAQIRILADTEEFYFDTQQFRAEGDAQITYGDVFLSADVVTGNPWTGAIEATGNVTFKQGERILRGETFIYNFKTDLGHAENASASVDNIHFHGEKLDARPEGFTLTRSRFTSCDAEKPHYYLSARELIIEPEVQLIARGVSIHAFGKTIMSVPRYRINLREGAKATTIKLPSVGVSSKHGPYAGYEFDLSPNPRTQGELDVRLSTRQAFQGGVKVHRIDGRPIMANVTYREPTYTGRLSDLMVSRLPEVAMGFSMGNAATIGKLEDSLHMSRRILNPNRMSATRSGINITGLAGAGYFSEEPTQVKSHRLDARALAWLDPLRIDDKTMVSPGVFARISQYGTRDTYTSLGFQLSAARRLGGDSYIAATYVTHAMNGRTPFEFDAVELPQELAGRVRFPVGNLNFELTGRYDLQNQRMFEREVSVSRVFHCIEPSIKWRDRFSEFSVNVGLVGF
jgi:lipopolysaccharide export system protein LptA